MIKTNLDLCRIQVEQSEVVQAEAADFLRRTIAQAPASPPWDIVFFDPPYDEDYFSILETFGAHSSCLIPDNGLLIVEHYHKNELQDEVGSIIRKRKLKQGDSVLSFYEMTE